MLDNQTDAWGMTATDKAGRPNIGHVLRVVDAVESHEEKSAAAMHDLSEDTPLTTGGPPAQIQSLPRMPAVLRSSVRKLLAAAARASALLHSQLS